MHADVGYKYMPLVGTIGDRIDSDHIRRHFITILIEEEKLNSRCRTREYAELYPVRCNGGDEGSRLSLRSQLSKEFP